MNSGSRALLEWTLGLSISVATVGVLAANLDLSNDDVDYIAGTLEGLRCSPHGDSGALRTARLVAERGFRSLDADRSGFLSCQELQTAMMQSARGMTTHATN